jgi:hypothetical protein
MSTRRVAVGVEDADDDQAHLVGLAHGVVLAAGSTTTIAPGIAVISRMPARLRVILRCSRRSEAMTFLEYWIRAVLLHGLELLETAQAAADDAEVRERAADPALGHDGHAVRSPASAITPLTWRFVPTQRIWCAVGDHVVEEVLRAHEARSVSRSSMTWIRLRRPWMYGAIFGFHRDTRHPKCTPASMSC